MGREEDDVASAAQLKAQLREAIDRARDWTYGIDDQILAAPELGYKEHKTAALVSKHLSELEIEHRTGLAVTGVKAVLDTGRPGPTVAVMGELDSVLVRDHPRADPQTGAAHACGHNAQIAALLGLARALVETGALRSLSGRIALMAVPAEEYVEVEYRLGLKQAGTIEFLGGKPELVRLGEFDDVDIAMMTHITPRSEDGLMSLGESMNGCVVKFVQYVGRAAHAGGAPHKGINALNAANIALSAIHAQRETFRDQDTVRVHPIITKGGDLVNVVPADVRMETFVRGKTLEAILDAERKVDRALRAGALAVGAQLRITTLPGYLPYETDQTLAEIVKDNAVDLLGADAWRDRGHNTGSTDMGDISHIMPAVHPFAGGARGTSHGADFEIVDREVAYLNPAKVMAGCLVDLLGEGASGARRVLAQAGPKMTKAEYLALMRGLDRVVEYKAEE